MRSGSLGAGCRGNETPEIDPVGNAVADTKHRGNLPLGHVRRDEGVRWGDDGLLFRQ